LGVISLVDVSGQATLLLERTAYLARRDEILAKLRAIAGIEDANAVAMQAYLDAYYEGYGKVTRKEDKVKPSIRIHPAKFQLFKEMWENLNRDAVLRYELEAQALVEKIVQRISTDFQVRPLVITVTRTESVESLHQAKSVQTPYIIKSQAVYSLSEFVRELANMTKLTYHTIGTVLSRMPAEKFDQIRHNENRALTALRDLILSCVYELMVNKVSYSLREVRVKTSLTDKEGQLFDTIPVSLCGVENHAILNTEVQDRSLYSADFMPVDSQIERMTVDESKLTSITVFAKLPKINIPTPVGKYNPDFGYVIQQGEATQALYLVVETKGYDDYTSIPTKEKWKIESAKKFFKALQELPALKQKGVQIHYQTKINDELLAQLISSIK
jgi:type III restriction enzyme